MIFQLGRPPNRIDLLTSIDGVDFEEAPTIFSDPLARIFEDEEHSEVEPREIIVGHSVTQRLMVACFTVRETRVRIISVRKATRLERKDYEENLHQ